MRAEEPAHSGGGSEPSGAFSYWMNSYPVGVTSSVQDLLNYSGAYIFTTGSADTSIAYQFAATNSTTWGETTNIAHGAYFIKKRGRYLRVIGTGPISGTVTVQVALPTGINISAITSLPTTQTIGSMSQYSVLSWTATPVTISAKCMVCLGAKLGPASVINYQFSTSATAPVSLTSTGAGWQASVGADPICWGPYSSGWLYMAGQAASATAQVQLDLVP